MTVITERDIAGRIVRSQSSIATIERFWQKVNKLEDGCWIWQANKTKRGYGMFWYNECKVFAHRFAFQLLVGDIPNNTELDHLCRNPSCVNPRHLEAVTHRDNCIRGIGPLITAERGRRKTHCPHGHPYDLINTYYTKEGWRKCRICLSGKIPDGGGRLKMKTFQVTITYEIEAEDRAQAWSHGVEMCRILENEVVDFLRFPTVERVSLLLNER